jgi:hypothetical protein
VRGWAARPEPPRPSANAAWARLPSAPSIPSASQGYGYDETAAGELVLHKGPQVTSGTAQDSVGPGHYTPLARLAAAGPGWSKSTSKRHSFVARHAGPGPGAYAPRSLVPSYKTKPSAAFVSSSKRATEIYAEDEAEDGVPGPGKYATQSCFTPSPVRKNGKNFGSCSERFKAVTPEPAHLGPGCYEVPTENFRVRNGESKAPFASKDLRFQQAVDLSPGPGAYVKMDVQRRVWGKQGAFGGTEKRFYSATTNSLPGPGSYAIERRVGVHNSASHKGHSVFVSKSKRIGSAGLAESPAPGSYEVVSPIGQVKGPPLPLHPVLVREDQPVKNVGFNTQAERFLAHKNGHGPGPGSYKIKENKGMRKVIVNKESRFKEKKKEIPGPGAYGEGANWNKRTFNVLFEQ